MRHDSRKDRLTLPLSPIRHCAIASVKLLIKTILVLADVSRLASSCSESFEADTISTGSSFALSMIDKGDCERESKGDVAVAA